MNKKNKVIKIGLRGVAFYTANKGCEALGYGFLYILKEIVKKNNFRIELYIFINFSNKTFFKWMLVPEFRKNVIPANTADNIKYILAPETDQIAKKITEKLLSSCDMLFDFTGGDSFTDIYGKERFYKNIFYKEMALKKQIPLILGSQTYGPFRDATVQNDAKKIINAAYEVFSRDIKSDECVMQLCGRKSICVTDVAFALPYKYSKGETSSKIRVGFNISGLLWEGGYSKNNQFGLTIDYRKYCLDVLDYLLLRQDQYEIHIIPHVFGTAKKGVYLSDDDRIPCGYLKKSNIDVIFSPEFATPMEAKSYIASMDIFIGSRMHATIAAFSSGVATIPVSYSRKFEGLYESFDYFYTVNATSLDTETAVKQTIDNIKNYKVIKSQVCQIMKEQVGSKLDKFRDAVEKILLKQAAKNI